MRVFSLFAAMALAVGGLGLAGCAPDAAVPVRVPGGDARVGAKLVEQYQCSACHTIPGVPGARGTAGPSLAAFGQSSYIAGRLPNVPEQLTAWLIDPPAMKPNTLMPNMGISPAEARHMAAFLYTVGDE